MFNRSIPNIPILTLSNRELNPCDGNSINGTEKYSTSEGENGYTASEDVENDGAIRNKYMRRKPKRFRSRFTPTQLALLEGSVSEDRYISSPMIQQLALKTGPKRSVKKVRPLLIHY